LETTGKTILIFRPLPGKSKKKEKSGGTQHEGAQEGRGERDSLHSTLTTGRTKQGKAIADVWRGVKNGPKTREITNWQKSL